MRRIESWTGVKKRKWTGSLAMRRYLPIFEIPCVKFDMIHGGGNMTGKRTGFKRPFITRLL